MAIHASLPMLGVMVPTPERLIPKGSLPTGSFRYTDSKDSKLASIYYLAHFYQNLLVEEYSPGQRMAEMDEEARAEDG